MDNPRPLLILGFLVTAVFVAVLGADAASYVIAGVLVVVAVGISNAN